MLTKPDCFIFSAQKSYRTTDENFLAHKDVKNLLQLSKIPFTEVVGRYKGDTETSFLVVGKEHEQTIKHLSDLYSQESYLHIHPDDFAELVFVAYGRRDKLGYLNEVSAQVANAAENSTFVPTTNLYYTTQPTKKW